MKLKIKDKNKFIKICLAIAIILIILHLTVPEILNSVFGNSLDVNIKTVTTDDFSQFDVGCVDGKFVVYNSHGLKSYDKNGKFESEYYVSAYEPFMDSNGDYVVLADASSSRVILLKDNKLKFETTLSHNINGVSVNKNGYVTVISEETGYKSYVAVYDSNGTEKYKWYSDENYATDAQLSDNSSTLAVASVNFDGKNVNTILQQYKIKSEAVLATTEINGVLGYRLVFDGDKVVLLSNEKAYIINKLGTLITEYDYKGRALECYDIDNKNNMSLALSDDTGMTDIVILDKNLKEKGVHKSEFLVSMLDENKGKTVVAGEGKIEILTEKAKILMQDVLPKEGKYIVLGNNWRKIALYNDNEINFLNVKRGKNK